MSMTTNSRGSKRLAGAGSLSYRMPVGRGLFPFRHIAESVKRNTLKCLLEGLNPSMHQSPQIGCL